MTIKLILQIISIIIGLLVGGGGLVTAGVGTYNYGFYGEAPSAIGWTSIIGLLTGGGAISVIVPLLLQAFWPKADPHLWKQVTEAYAAGRAVISDPQDIKKRYIFLIELQDVQYSVAGSLADDPEITQKQQELSELYHKKLNPIAVSQAA